MSGDIRPVSAEQIEDARSNGDEGRDRRPSVNLIDYLAHRKGCQSPGWQFHNDRSTT